MKKFFSFALVAGLVSWLVKYLKGDTEAGEWHDLPGSSSGL